MTAFENDPRFTRRSMLLGSLFAAAAATPVLKGCADPSLAMGGEPGDEDIFEEVTDVSHTLVKNQSIGNCWAYAACGWAESLHRARTGMDMDMSESWITFWDWYGKIGQSFGGVETNAMGVSEVSTGAWWDTAANVCRQRGVVSEGDFIPEEAMATRSSRQSAALSATNASLNGMGALATAAARRDKTLVLNTLMDAWQLRPEVRTLITRVFGASGVSTLQTTRERTFGFIKRASDIPVKYSVLVRSTNGTTRSQSVDGTLIDVVPGGRNAWSTASYPTGADARLAFQRRIMRALNDAQPVLISWLVDFNARTSAGAFKLEQLMAAGRQGGHLTVIEDYQATIRQAGAMPRTLPAGVAASQADKDLAVTAGELEFIRIKNSWGTAQDSSGSGMFGGYHDLYANYLNGPITWSSPMSQRTPMSSVILPKGY